MVVLVAILRMSGVQAVKIGIVGSEAAKFNQLTEALARQEIRRLIDGASLVISGHSPLGGIDWWAIEEATWAGVATREHQPKINAWSPPGGYKDRNLKIAQDSDLVACITVRELPPTYRGMRFPGGCYHCQRYAPHFGGTAPEHVKSGGCWTMWQAAHLGKKTELVVIE